jgi:hypothetical protein
MLKVDAELGRPPSRLRARARLASLGQLFNAKALNGSAALFSLSSIHGCTRNLAIPDTRGLILDGLPSTCLPNPLARTRPARRSCVCLHALSSFQRTDRRPPSRPVPRSSGEPSKLTTARLSRQALFSARRFCWRRPPTGYVLGNLLMLPRFLAPVNPKLSGRQVFVAAPPTRPSFWGTFQEYQSWLPLSTLFFQPSRSTGLVERETR